MLGRRGWLLLAVACKGGEEPEGPAVAGDDDDHQIPVAVDTGTAPIVPDRPSFDCFADVSYDDGRDGVIDGGGLEGYRDGWLVYADRDLNGNGLLETVDLYERDSDGNVTLRERQRTGPQIVRSTWDDRGNLLTQETDIGSDAVIDSAVVYQWDPNDELLHYETHAGPADDGAPTYVIDYQRTPRGLPISASEDTNGDGNIDTLSLYTHDDQGRPAQISIDSGNDGVVDRIDTYTYTDPALEVGSVAEDEGGDGVIESSRTFAYDVEGRELYYAIDDPAGGILEQEEITERDPEGRILSYTVTVGGTEGYSYTFDYTYDDLGRAVERTLIYTYATGEVALNEQLNFTFGGSCP